MARTLWLPPQGRHRGQQRRSTATSSALSTAADQQRPDRSPPPDPPEQMEQGLEDLEQLARSPEPVGARRRRRTRRSAPIATSSALFEQAFAGAPADRARPRPSTRRGHPGNLSTARPRSATWLQGQPTTFQTIRHPNGLSYPAPSRRRRSWGPAGRDRHPRLELGQHLVMLADLLGMKPELAIAPCWCLNKWRGWTRDERVWLRALGVLRGASATAAEYHAPRNAMWKTGPKIPGVWNTISSAADGAGAEAAQPDLPGAGETYALALAKKQEARDLRRGRGRRDPK